MNGKRTEACGRCSMSTVVDLATEDDADASGDADGGEGGVDDGVGDTGDVAASDPFAGGHIQVQESAVRAVSPSAWLDGVRRRIDDLATRLTYGR